MAWGFFAASGPGQLVKNDGTMNPSLYQKIQEENDGPSASDLLQSLSVVELLSRTVL